MKSNPIFTFLIYSLLALVITSCQTSRQMVFDEIAIGAKKGEVLNAIGSPTRTYRKNGTERWVYKMQSKSGTWMYKELVIRNGIVINKEVPEQSAKPKESDYEEVR